MLIELFKTYLVSSSLFAFSVTHLKYFEIINSDSIQECRSMNTLMYL